MPKTRYPTLDGWTTISKEHATMDEDAKEPGVLDDAPARALLWLREALKKVEGIDGVQAQWGTKSSVIDATDIILYRYTVANGATGEPRTGRGMIPMQAVLGMSHQSLVRLLEQHRNSAAGWV